MNKDPYSKSKSATKITKTLQTEGSNSIPKPPPPPKRVLLQNQIIVL